MLADLKPSGRYLMSELVAIGGIQPLMSGHAGGKRLAHVIYQLLVGAGDLLAAAATFGL